MKTKLLVPAGLLLLGLCACGSGVAASATGGPGDPATIAPRRVQHSVPSTPSTPSVSPPPATPTPDLPPAHTFTTNLTTSEGFKLRVHTTVYDAIKGSDSGRMAAMWSQVGGTGVAPCQDADVSNDMSIGTAIHTQTSAYAFGTVMVTSLTQGFDPPDTIWQFAAGRAAPTGDEWVGSMGGAKAMGVGFSDGPQCDGLSAGFMFHPKMTGPTWGPAPIVFAFDGTFTPNHPNGDPAAVADFPISVAALNGAKTYDAAGKQVPGIQVHLASIR